MSASAWTSAGLATLLALALGACSERADQNPNAPGSPGSNSAEVVRPAAPDGPPGGPSGVAGSAPHTGASGGDAVPGTTGSSSAEVAGRDKSAQPGVGLDGGLASSGGLTGSFPTTSAPMGAGAAQGSPNTTPGNAVGSR